MDNSIPFLTVAIVGFMLAMAAAITAIASGFGHRFGIWSFATGFTVLKWGVYIAILALAILLTALYLSAKNSHRGSLLLSLIGLTAALATVIPPLLWIKEARSLPRIHDITTDTENPPTFSAILPLRHEATNPVDYGGAEIAKLQHEGYPEVKPLDLKMPTSTVFEAAQQVVHEMDWEVISADRDKGIIEATATTFWFGFTDDVIIRITPQSGGTRVDVRSLSRVGLSDVGTNAKRIVKFNTALQSTLANRQ